MKTTNGKTSPRLRLRYAVSLALAAFVSTASAQTIWDGGASPDTSINNATNWNNDVAILTGSQAVSFAASTSLSNVATMNVPAKFKTILFNKANGFTVDGSSTLTVSNSTASGSPNITVSGSQNAGPTVINAPFAVETGTSATKLLNILNNSAPGGPGLIFSNTISASVPANPFAFRLQGTGLSRYVGAITNCTSIQPALGVTVSGTNIFAGNQILATNGVIACDVQIPSTTTSSSSATTRIQMGESINDIQTWRSTVVHQNGTIAINSTATLLGGVGVMNVNSGGVAGGILEVNGSVTATTLSIGSGTFAGTMKLAGPAYFSGLMSVGATSGSLILGNAATVSPLTLSSGTISSSVTIGGAGVNENNITLIKTNSGTLTLGGTHTYTGPTVVQAGQLDLTGTIASSVTVSNGATLGGEGNTAGSITFGPGSTLFNFDPSTAGFLLADSINGSAGVILVNPSTNTSGVVFESTNTIVGTIGLNFILAARGGSLSFNGTTNQLLFTSGPTTAADLKWAGTAANPSFWDIALSANWSNGVAIDRFYSSDNVRFDDSATSFTVAIQGASVSPGNTVISNNANAYTFNGGSISGSGGLTKDGAAAATVNSGGHSFTGGLTVNNGTLNLFGSSGNNFTGGVTHNGGTLVISNMNQIAATATASPNAINLNGGGFIYSGPTFSQSTDTLGLNLLGGVSTIEVGGTNSVTLRAGGAVTGAGDLIKSGPGTLALGRNTVQTPLGNTFTGKILVTGGQLDIRQSDSLGSTNGITELTNATLYLDPFGQPSGMTFDAEPLLFSGNCYIRNYNQSATVSQVDVLTGAITNNGTLGIYCQTNGGYGELQVTGNIVNGPGSSLALGKLGPGIIGVSTNGQIITVIGVVSGPASVSAEGNATSVYTLANNNYTGDTTVTGGKLVLGQATLATNSIVTVASNAVLQLDFTGVTNTIGSLVLNGVAQAAGVYDSTTSSPYIAGGGSLLVNSSPAPIATNITYSVVGGNQLVLNWPAGQGWTLQSQTNTLASGLTTNWADVTSTPPHTNTVNPANPSVFFRLKY